ncbi:hypothetical protein AB0I53_17545 [Saccharopolyspora sp. NPDC050389]
MARGICLDRGVVDAALDIAGVLALILRLTESAMIDRDHEKSVQRPARSA